MSISPLNSTVPKLTFICHDAGETDAMMPVMAALDNRGIDYRVLSFSTSQRLLAENPVLRQKTLFLSQADTFTLRQPQVQLALSAPTFMTGVMTPVQQRLGQWLKGAGKQVLGFYDAFSVNPFPAAMQAIQASVSTLLCPSSLVQQQFQFVMPTVLTGSPAVTQSISSSSERALLHQQLQLDSRKPTLLFIGGWYTPQYQQAFHLFCRSVLALKQQGQQFNLLVSPHPQNNNPYFEKELLSQYGLINQVKILPKEQRAKQLLPVTDVVVSHQSTFNTQALINGKPVINLGPKNSPSDYLPDENAGLVKRVHSIEQFEGTLRQAIQTGSSPLQALNNANWLGIPLNALQNVLMTLERYLFTYRMVA